MKNKSRIIYYCYIELDKDLTNFNLEKDSQLLLHSNTLGRNIGKIKVVKTIKNDREDK